MSVKKTSGKIKICTKFSIGLNNTPELHEEPPLLPEDILATLNDGRFFSLINLADTYLQVEVDDESKKNGSETAIVHASRSLTITEQSYSQIEK